MTNTCNLYLPSSETEKFFIKSIWRIREFSQDFLTETILPKGTVELIFNLSDNITYVKPDANFTTRLPDCFINGLNLKPFQLIKKGRQEFLGLQLNTVALKALFNTPARELNDIVLEGSDICKSVRELHSQLFAESNFDIQVDILKKWICKRISDCKHLPTIRRFHDWFFCQNVNGLSVNDLRQKVFVSDRQMRRVSSEWLGMNIEKFLQYNKYLTSLNHLHHTQLSLTEIGLTSGYYDQSHFIREFKSFTGLTPKEYKASATFVPGHIIQ